MALDIKDGLGAAETLKTTLDGADHVPHHNVDSSALPTGASTAANQTTANGLLTTIDADTGSISTSASAINGKITACNTGAVVLAAGTAAIGKLAANSGVDIGDVDVTSLPALPAGTNNIGDVDVLTLPALAAGTNLVGKAAAGLDVSNLYDGATALTPKFAKLSSASTGNQALVSAVVGKKLRLLSLQILATASTNAVYINDGTADLYGDSTRKIPLDVTGATGPGGITLPFNPIGWCESAATNRPLNINLGSANGIIALATYVEV